MVRKTLSDVSGWSQVVKCGNDRVESSVKGLVWVEGDSLKSLRENDFLYNHTENENDTQGHSLPSILPFFDILELWHLKTSAQGLKSYPTITATAWNNLWSQDVFSYHEKKPTWKYKGSFRWEPYKKCEKSTNVMVIKPNIICSTYWSYSWLFYKITPFNEFAIKTSKHETTQIYFIIMFNKNSFIVYNSIFYHSMQMCFN